MWLDVVLFATLAFAGSENYLSIMQGTLLSRLVVSVFACPVLYFYLEWQKTVVGVSIENRPVLAILREVAEVRAELTLAQQEIERRKQAEREKEEVIRKLEETLARVKTLEGLLPICSSCKKIRTGDSPDGKTQIWVTLEEYLMQKTSVEFTHGMCMECVQKEHPEIHRRMMARRAGQDPGQASEGPPAPPPLNPE
jgi:hypothetical protein